MFYVPDSSPNSKTKGKLNKFKPKKELHRRKYLVLWKLTSLCMTNKWEPFVRPGTILKKGNGKFHLVNSTK